MTVAEEVAAYLGEHCPHVFAIIGAGNMALLDAIARLGKTEVIYQHHEQACVMSAAAYYRVCGKHSAAIVTTGAGGTNAFTGLLSAHMDSIPVLVIAGNEASGHRRRGRGIGVQGFYSAQVADFMCKLAVRVDKPEIVAEVLDELYRLCVAGRPGPCWLELPMNTASAAA